MQRSVGSGNRMISLAQSLASNAEARPDEVAVVDRHRSVTYRDLRKETAELAACLATATDAPVGLLVGNRVEHLIALFAADLAGHAVAPLDPKWSPAELQSALELLSIDLVIVEASQRSRLPRDVRALVADDAEFPLAHPRGGNQRRREGASLPDERVHVYSLTGGTSGRCKAVAISRFATIARIVAQVVELGSPRTRRFLASTPLYHGSARSLALAHLWAGGSVHLEPSFEPGRVCALLNDSCDSTFVVPTMLADILDSGKRVRSRSRFICSGAALPAGLAREFQEKVNRNLYNYFASVEAGGVSLVPPAEVGRSDQVGGHSFMGTRITITDEQGVAISRGQLGVVAVSSPSLSSAVVTAEGVEQTLDPYLTGDLGFLDQAGRLHLHGRRDDVVISGGVNVDPLEVEAVFAEIGGLREVCVVGVPDARWGERLVLVYAKPPNCEFDLDELAGKVEQRLSPPKRPKKYLEVPRLPLTAIGKPNRRAIKELAKEMTS